MLRRKGMLLALVLALSGLLVPLSRAQDDDNDEVSSHVRIVRLSYAEGSVQLSSDRGVENATMNVPITEGNRLSTSSNGWAEIQLEDGSTIRLAPSTQITFSELGRDSSGDTLTTVDLDQGEAQFSVSRRHDSQFAVTARNKAIVLKHSGRFRVLSTNQNPLEIAVFKGEVQVEDSDAGTQVSVKKDETFALDPGDVSHYALDRGTENDDLDQWAQQRDQALATYASGGNGNYSRSPYQYGLSDLSYYGTYTSVPGYGYLWQPYGAGLGWDPFMNGYWSNCALGPCWVSAYPWGWMPYRYGNWIFFNGLGWMWQPGGWGGWWRQPRVIHAPPGFHPPAPPARVATITRSAGSLGTSAQPGVRPRRVFSNDDVERREPGGTEHALSSPAFIGNTPVERKPAFVERQGRTTTESNHTGRAREVHRGQVPAATVPGTPPAPAPTRPASPVIHAQPAPAVAPSRPASPPPPPHMAPPSRSFSAPASHMEGGGMSRNAGNIPTGRPR
jgi:FecR protein